MIIPQDISPQEKLIAFKEELNKLNKSEIYQPKALMRRCIEISEDSTKTILDAIGTLEIWVGLHLKEMVQDKLIGVPGAQGKVGCI